MARRLFDLNGDGRYNARENALRYSMMEDLLYEDRSGRDLDFSEDDLDLDDEDERELALEEAGLDPYDLKYMDEYERAEALEDAGFDAGDFDSFGDW